MSFDSDTGLCAWCMSLESCSRTKRGIHSFMCEQGAAGLRKMSTFVLGQDKSKQGSAKRVSEAFLSTLERKIETDTQECSSESPNVFDDRPEVSTMSRLV